MPDPHFQENDFYQVCQYGAAWFEEKLYADEAVGIRETLLKRGIDESISRKWNLGFCPAGKANELLNYLEAAGFSSGLALTSGLFFHDRKLLQLREAFSNRLVIPKRDASGKIAGFGARLLTKPTHFIPKYIQSAETPIYSMYNHLFGIDKATDSIAEKGFVILAEGYFDIVFLHEHGLLNSVALIGTRIGKGQLNALCELSKRVLIMLDGDQPGRDGAALIATLLKKENIEVKIYKLPEGEDPDSMLRSKNSKSFIEELKGGWR